MKYNRLLPLLIPFLVLLLFEVFFFIPRMIYVCLVLANLLIFFAVNQFIRAGDIVRSWWNFFILPAFFATSLAVYSILFASKLVVQILFVINFIFLYFYLRIIYSYLVQPVSYRDSALENISSLGNFLTFFFVSSVIYGLQSFLNMPTWLLMAVLVIISAFVMHQIFWSNKIELKDTFIYILVCCLILVELAWSISFLPLNFNVAGLILAICYYIIIGIIKHHLLGQLDRRKVKLYLIFGLCGILIIMLTARWI
jgi:hypothetical protein